jgi:hypothetical protein
MMSVSQEAGKSASWLLGYLFSTAFAVLAPAIRPNVIVSEMELPPRRFAP